MYLFRVLCLYDCLSSFVLNGVVTLGAKIECLACATGDDVSNCVVHMVLETIAVVLFL